MLLPPLYPIIDFSCFAAKPDPITAIVRYAEELIAAGATLIQLRDKSQPEQPQAVSKLCAGAASGDLGYWKNGFWNNAQSHADHQ